jgi:hypothetical protein
MVSPTIQTSSQAAEALRPIAGRFAFTIFALGIGTGLLALPVLAGSAAYAVGEALHWRVGLAQRPGRARAFYGTIAVATFVGAALNFTPLDPIKAERRDQRGGCGADHGHDHADGLAAAGDGAVHADAVADVSWLARYSGDDRGLDRNVRDLGQLSTGSVGKPAHSRPHLAIVAVELLSEQIRCWLTHNSRMAGWNGHRRAAVERRREIAALRVAYPHLLDVLTVKAKTYETVARSAETLARANAFLRKPKPP